MTTLLLWILVLSFIGLLSLLGYQFWRLKTERVFIGENRPHLENPLSVHNIQKSREVVISFLEERGRNVIYIVLKLTILGKKVIKRKMDGFIVSLSKIAFPEEKKNGTIRPNKFVDAAHEEKAKVRGEEQVHVAE